MVKNLPATGEAQSRSLVTVWIGGAGVKRERKITCRGNATYSSVLAWRIPRTEGPGGLQSVG